MKVWSYSHKIQTIFALMYNIGLFFLSSFATNDETPNNWHEKLRKVYAVGIFIKVCGVQWMIANIKHCDQRATVYFQDEKEKGRAGEGHDEHCKFGLVLI